MALVKFMVLIASKSALDIARKWVGIRLKKHCLHFILGDAETIQFDTKFDYLITSVVSSRELNGPELDIYFPYAVVALTKLYYLRPKTSVGRKLRNKEASGKEWHYW